MGETMKTASVRQIRNAFPSILRLVQNGETVAITSRRKIVATLTPPPKPAPSSRAWADLDQRFAALKKQPMMRESGAELMARDRERY